ncbi:MAG TPA: hypothetical protein VLK22_03560 [Candidatus Udaeobacter sp.]|nr:hypothetical protein [Candidatus Udaeobacter sp.]
MATNQALNVLDLDTDVPADPTVGMSDAEVLEGWDALLAGLPNGGAVEQSEAAATTTNSLDPGHEAAPNDPLELQFEIDDQVMLIGPVTADEQPSDHSVVMANPPTVDEEWPAIDKLDVVAATNPADPNDADEFGGDTKEIELPQFPDSATEPSADGDGQAPTDLDADPNYAEFEVEGLVLDEDDRPLMTSGTIVDAATPSSHDDQLRCTD